MQQPVAIHPTTNEKRAKFIERAERRTANAIRAIRLIGNLGNRATYEFSELDTAKILGALEEAITDVKKRMVAPEEKSETAFKL